MFSCGGGGKILKYFKISRPPAFSFIKKIVFSKKVNQKVNSKVKGELCH